MHDVKASASAGLRKAADFVEVTPPDHGHIETRRIWCSTALNAYLDFPRVGQVFLIERESVKKKTGEFSREIALGITSRTGWPRAAPQQASPQMRIAAHGLRPAPPYRLRSRKYHSPSPLRGRHPQVFPETRTIHRRNDALSLLSYSPRLRLSADDEKLSRRVRRNVRTNLPWPPVEPIARFNSNHTAQCAVGGNGPRPLATPYPCGWWRGDFIN